MGAIGAFAMIAPRSLFIWGAIAVSLSLGCGAPETVDPVPRPSTTTTPPDTGSGGGGGEGGAAATPIRTVEQRHPFGNVAATDNLLWDGDFEWSSAFADQYGWLSGPPYSYSFPWVTIGAACRSGVKCVTLPKNKAVVGIGVGAESAPVAVTVFAKPATGTCSGVDVFLLQLFPFSKDVNVPPIAETPDATGWCQYQATVETYPEKVYLLVDNNTGEALVVDDAVVRAVPPPGAPPAAAPAHFGPPTAERAARLDEAREAIRSLRGPHVPPPNAARRAFEERHAR
jgi:hypothetical protein